MQLLISGDALIDKDIPLHWLKKTAKTAVQSMRTFIPAKGQMKMYSRMYSLLWW